MLKIFAHLILKKYKPTIIGISGSIGKTSARLAVQAVLSDKNVRSNNRPTSDEKGIYSTIINGSQYRKTLSTIFSALMLLLRKDKRYPEILVLELFADKPGDLNSLYRNIKFNIGIITSVSPTQLETFGTLVKEAEEKSILVNSLSPTSLAIINNDNKFTRGLQKKTRAKILTFGLTQDADVWASDILINREAGGIKFKVNYNGSSVPVSLESSLGKPTVYSCLAAVAVGISLNLNLVAISAKLNSLGNIPGRLSLLPGIKGTRIIDDSYDASPLSVSAAIEVLTHLKCTGNKFAVLGDMLKLGTYTKQAHREVGESIAKFGIDYLICVGERSTDTALAAKEYGMNPDRIFTFDKSAEAGKFIQDRIQEGDLILVKGSRGMKMEKIVKEIMAEPQRAKELLVR